MFASVVEIQLKPDALDGALDVTRAVLPELKDVPGLKQLISINKGNDKALVVVIYASQADQEAATPKAAELLGRIAGLAVAHPVRSGCEVNINEHF